MEAEFVVVKVPVEGSGMPGAKFYGAAGMNGWAVCER
jgi:hypothetical protein